MKVDLLTNKHDKNRINILLEDIVDNPRENAIILLEEVDLKYFYGNDNKAKLKVLETNNIKDVGLLRSNPKNDYNLCIIEIQNLDNNQLNEINDEFTGKKDLIGVVINKTLTCTYRLNYLSK